jgi:hypothetical protein
LPHQTRDRPFGAGDEAFDICGKCARDGGKQR